TPESLRVLRDADIPAFHSPEAAVRTFGCLWRHAETQRCLATFRWALAEDEPEAKGAGRAGAVIAAARAAGREALTDAEARAVPWAYGLPVEERRPAGDEAEAAEAAEALGYPVLVELGAGDAEVVQLRAADHAALRRALQTLRLLARE